jgi:hypothetical protein
MKPEIKKQWVAALRSGKYNQGSGRLKSYDNDEAAFCCLGVLCDLHAKSEESDKEDWFRSGLDYASYMEQANYTPRSVMEWADLPQNDPLLRIDGHGVDISALNDKGYPFVTLAKLIEEQL